MNRAVHRLEGILREDGEEPPLRTWDWRYCDTRLRRRDYAVDPDELKQYLPLEAVFDGLLGLCAEVFGLAFERVADAAAWHPDVVRFRVRDATSGAEIGAWELAHRLEIPYRVVINEAVELAKSYGGTDGHKFVNGVLDKLAAELRAAEIAALAEGRGAGIVDAA